MRNSTLLGEKSKPHRIQPSKLHDINKDDVDGSISSSSEYSTDSDEDDSSSEPSSETSSSEEEEILNKELAETNEQPKPFSSSVVRSPSKEIRGISRASILEGLQNSSSNKQDKTNLNRIDTLNLERNKLPTDFSLAFIGCEDSEQRSRTQKLQYGYNKNDNIEVTSNVRRKPSSLSQRYGMVRRSTSRGSVVMPTDEANVINKSEMIGANNKTHFVKEKSLELDDIQLDENIKPFKEKSMTTKVPSPNLLRPENKVILGDSIDNVSILTDGMLN